MRLDEKAEHERVESDKRMTRRRLANGRQVDSRESIQTSEPHPSEHRCIAGMEKKSRKTWAEIAKG